MPAAPQLVREDTVYAGSVLEKSALQKAIFNSANFSSIATDAKGVIQIFNVGAERMFGYTAAEVVNKITPAEISDPQEVIARATALTLELSTPIAPGFEAFVFKALRGIEDIYELTYIRKDGTRVPAMVSVTALRDEHGSVIGYLLIGTDNTMRKQATEEMALQRHQLQTKLNESNRRLATTLASLGEGVVSTDAEGIVTTVNRVAAAMLGKHEDVLIGKKIGDAFDLAPGDRAGLSELMADPVSQLLAAGKEKLSYSNTSIHNANGEEMPVDVTASLIVGDGHSPEGAVLVFRDITLRKQSEEDLRHRAYHDQLTGLPNRSLLFERLHAAIAQCARHARSLALLFLDLDDFKKINDTLGHDAGDLLLKQLAERLTTAVRDDDIVTRLAGDEFVIILSDIADISDVKEVVTKILAKLEVPFPLGEDEVRITASIGAALFPSHGINTEQLMSYADKAMYRAKQQGKNAYAIYSAN